MAAAWTPHLDGKQSIADSLSALVAMFKADDKPGG
jgi:hypothetical protein